LHDKFVYCGAQHVDMKTRKIKDIFIFVDQEAKWKNIESKGTIEE